METYDEDLYENKFFVNFQKSRQLFEHVTSQRFVELFFNCNTITTGAGFEMTQKVTVLFEEMFFNKTDESYRVLCISRPLDSLAGTEANKDCQKVLTSGASSVQLYSLEDCAELLWGNRGNVRLKRALTHLINKCHKTLMSSPSAWTLSQLQTLIQTLYTNAMALILKDSAMKKVTTNSRELRHNITVAAETYLLHGIYWPVFRHVCTFTAARDAQLNKITRNMTSILQLCHLGIASEFRHSVPRARKELSNLARFTSPRGKLHCLQRVVRALVRFVQRDGNPKSVHDDVVVTENHCTPMSTDDLLPILIFLVVRTEMSNWWGQLTFIQSFCLMRELDDEFKFYLATVEAALEHITSGQLSHIIGTSDQLSEYVCDSLPSAAAASPPTSPDDVNQFFKLIIAGRVDEVKKQIVAGVDISKAAVMSHISDDDDVGVRRCHPLCSCNVCAASSVKHSALSSPDHVPVDVFSRNDRGFCALHVAAVCGHMELCDWLVNLGAVIDAAEHHGYTPLHLAAQSGHQAIIVLLLHHKSNCIGVVDHAGNTALHYAALHGQDSCVKALVFINHGGLLDIDAQNDFGDTSLHIASRWGFETIVETLLDGGAAVNVRNRQNQLAAHCTHNLHIQHMLSTAATAATTARPFTVSTVGNEQCLVQQHQCDQLMSLSTEGWEVVSGCRQHHHDQLKCSEVKVESGPSGLLQSVADNDINMVKYQLGWLELESDDSDISKVDITTASLCHPLCQCDQCRRYQQLTEPCSATGLHVNSVDADGVSSLHVAARHGHVDMTRLLLRRGAIVNAASGRPLADTPLHLACRHAHYQVVRLLVSYGADVNQVDSVGDTPLHVCCATLRCQNIAFYLLLLGANVSIVNRAGETPTQTAVRCQLTLIVDVVRQLSDAHRPCHVMTQSAMGVCAADDVERRLVASISVIRRRTSRLARGDAACTLSAVSAVHSSQRSVDDMGVLYSHADTPPTSVPISHSSFVSDARPCTSCST